MTRQRVWIAALFLLTTILAGCQQQEDEASSDLMERARGAIAERRYSDALDLMRRLVARHPDDAEIQRIYGEALLTSGQPSLAVWPLNKAMRETSQTVPAGLLLATAQLRGGSGDDAIRTAGRVLEVDPENGTAYLLRARAYLRENAEEKALEDIDRAAERGIDETEVELLRLDAYLGLRREKEAETLLAKLHARAIAEIATNPAQAAQLCAATARFQFERGDPQTAIARFDECLESDGYRNGVLMQAAIEFFDGRGDLERATDIYWRRFENDVSNLIARVRYADRLQAVGRSKEAEDLLIEATDEQPAAWSALVDYYVVAQDFQKALDALDKAIAANPDPPDGWYLSRTDFLIILGAYDEAEKSLSSIKLPGHRTLVEGRLALARGQLSEAAKSFEAGIRLWPDNPDARYLAGFTYERMGEWGRAASHYREAARMDPPHYESSRALADIQQALGDEKGRGFVLARLLEFHPNDPDLLEALSEYARATGSEKIARHTFVRLARLPGMAGRALALAAAQAHADGGAEAALAAIDKGQVDLVKLENVEALSARCTYLGELARFDEARASIESALAIHSDSDRLLVLRGDTHLAAGEAALAGVDFSRAHEIAPRSLDASLGLARAHQALGEIEAAKAGYREAIALEVELQDKRARAALALARLALGEGRRDEAKTLLQDVLDRSPRNGEASLLLARMLLDEPGGEAVRRQALDLARRAALFAASDDTRALLASLKASQAPKN